MGVYDQALLRRKTTMPNKIIFSYNRLLVTSSEQQDFFHHSASPHYYFKIANTIFTITKNKQKNVTKLRAINQRNKNQSKPAFL